jgi:hypothetical protein
MLPMLYLMVLIVLCFRGKLLKVFSTLDHLIDLVKITDNQPCQIGAWPVAAVRVMADICREAESQIDYRASFNAMPCMRTALHCTIVITVCQSR